MGYSTRLRSALSLAAAAVVLGAATAPLAAQATGTIRGTVTEASSQRPLSGAQVTVVGGSRRAVTNAAGEYVLANVPAGTVNVRAELLGHTGSSRSVNVTAGGTATANFTLGTSAIALDALVVTGTPGATERRSVGNVVTTVNASEITDRAPVANVAQLLQARAPGLTVLPGSGTAGAAASIRIRGTGSISGGNQPIFYIDGVRMNSNTIDPGVAGQQLSTLDAINPEDIESIEVIKGPAAATLYGAEAAAGVIQIITKKGKVGDQKIQWSAKTEQGFTRWGAPMPTNYLLCSPARIATSAPSNGTYFAGCAGIDPTAPAEQRVISQQPLFDAISDGKIQNYNLSARGGGERYSFYLSGDKDSENGIFSNNYFKRTGGRTNFFVSPKDNLDFAVNLNVNRTHGRLPLNDNASSGWLRNAFRGYPFVRLAGTFQEGWRGLSPTEMRIFNNQTRTDRVVLGATANFQPWHWFRNRLTAGLDGSQLLNTEFYPIDRTGRAPYGPTAAIGYISQWDLNNRDYTVDYAGTLTNELPAEIQSNFSFGMQFLGRRSRDLQGVGEGLINDNVRLVSTATTTRAFEGFSETNSLGVFVQEQIGWRNRLFLTGALRADDNSTFGADFDYVLYPKAAIAYVVSEEDWFNLPSVNELKLRAAWGRAGNSPGAFAADRTYAASTVILDNGGDGVARSAFRASAFGNRDLKAETGSEIEVGMDASLLQDRMGLEATFYNKTTRDALLGVPVAPSSGFNSSPLQNVGEINNKGFELALYGTPIRSPRFTWDSRIGFSTNRNEFVSFGGSRTNEEPILYGFTNEGQQIREGYPLAGYWAIDFQRNEDGTMAYRTNANGSVSALFQDTAIYIGTPVPTKEASFSNTFTLFNNLQLYAFVDYKGGHHQHNLTQQFRDNDGNTWEIVNPDTSLANRVNKLGRGFISDIRYIEKADAIKLREVSATYTVPASLTRRFGTDGLSFSVAGRNLKTWTDYSGTDPEGNISGPATFSRSDYMTVPAMRQWVATVNVRF